MAWHNFWTASRNRPRAAVARQRSPWTVLGTVDALEERILLAADLGPVSISTSTPYLTPGSWVSVQYQIANYSSQATNGGYNTSFYLSRNQTFEIQDIFLGDVNYPFSQAGNAGTSGYVGFMTPAYDSPAWRGDGTYYILMLIDSWAQVPENNEVNFGYGLGVDHASIAVFSTPPGPDLIGTAMSVTQGTIAPGAEVQIQFEVTNQGYQMSQSGWASVYLSRNTTIGDGNDVYLTDLYIPQIAGSNGNYLALATVTMPGPESSFWGSEGTAYLGMYIDMFDFNIYETNNSNNANRGIGLDFVSVKDVTIGSFDRWAALPVAPGTVFNAWLQAESDNLTALIASVQKIENAAVGIVPVTSLVSVLQSRKTFLSVLQQQVQALQNGVVSSIFLSSTVTMDLAQLSYIDRFIKNDLSLDFVLDSASAVPLSVPRGMDVEAFLKPIVQPLHDLRKAVANGISKPLTKLSETLQGLVGNGQAGARIQAQVTALREGISTALTQGSNAITQKRADGQQIFQELQQRLQSYAWDSVQNHAVEYLDSKFDDFSQYWVELQELRGYAEMTRDWVNAIAPYFDAISNKLGGEDPDDPKPPKSKNKGAWKGDLSSTATLPSGQTVVTESAVTFKIKDNKNGGFKGKMSFPLLELDAAGNVVGKQGKTKVTFNVISQSGETVEGVIELKAPRGQSLSTTFSWTLRNGVLSGPLYAGSLSSFSVRQA